MDFGLHANNIRQLFLKERCVRGIVGHFLQGVLNL
jgi:hypothetical protein